MIRIEISTDNAAFDGEKCGPELARILRDLATRIADYRAEEFQQGDGWRALDINGNVVGRLVVA